VAEKTITKELRSPARGVVIADMVGGFRFRSSNIQPLRRQRERVTRAKYNDSEVLLHQFSD
jgi:hypothetical protein